MARVLVADSVYQVCTSHALMTEREEVMGLLLGRISGEEVHVWHSVTLHRSDKRPDRCEISPEQLAGAASSAEAIGEKVGFDTRVVGWYHSHPHITCLPSHVDLRTQMMYQGMERSFVGLIFAVFNSDPARGSARYELLGFRAEEGRPGQPLQQVLLDVRVAALGDLLPCADERLPEAAEALGGSLGHRGVVATARAGFEEIHLHRAAEQQESHARRDAIPRALGTAEYMRQVVQFVSEELSPLQPFLEDARHNAEVMAAVDRRHCRFAKALPAERWSSKWHPAAAGPPQEAPAAQGSTARRSPRVGPEEPAQPLQPEHREHRASLLRRSRANDASLLVLDDAEPPAAGRVPSPERERAAPPQQAPRFDPTRCIAITKWGVQCENKPKRNLCEEQDWEYCGRHTSYSRGGDTVHPNCPHGDMNDVVPAASPAPAREEMRELNRTELGTIRQFTGTGVIVAERIGGEQKTFETKHSDEDEAYMQAQMFLQHVAHVVDGAPAASSGDAPARQPRAAAALLAEAGSSPAGAAAAPAAPARPSEASAEAAGTAGPAAAEPRRPPAPAQPAVRSRAAAAPAAQRSAPAAEARGRGAAAAAAEAAGGAGGAPGGLPRPEREAASRAGFTGALCNSVMGLLPGSWTTSGARGAGGAGTGSATRADAAAGAEGAPSTAAGGPLVGAPGAGVASNAAGGPGGNENDGAGVVIDAVASDEEEAPADRGPQEAGRRKRRKVACAEGVAPAPPPPAGRGRGGAASAGSRR